jgi:hypothetical protein
MTPAGQADAYIPPLTDRACRVGTQPDLPFGAPAQGQPDPPTPPVRPEHAMGQKQRNVEAVTDFADGRHFVRLHRDIPLPAEVCEAVRRHLAADRWAEAKSLTLEHATEDSHAEIELFFTSTADRLARAGRAGDTWWGIAAGEG